MTRCSCEQMNAFLARFGVRRSLDDLLGHFGDEDEFFRPLLVSMRRTADVARYDADHALFRFELRTYGEVRSHAALLEHAAWEDSVLLEILANHGEQHA